MRIAVKLAVFLLIFVVAGVVYMKHGKPSTLAPQSAASKASAANVKAKTVARLRILEAGLKGLGGAAIAPDGTIWVWGIDARIEPTDETTRFQARLLPGIGEVVALSMARCSMLALRADGTVWSTGCNGQGQLGVGTGGALHYDNWQPVSQLADVKQIVANGANALALKNDGTVWAWGLNDPPVFGSNFRETVSHQPRQIVELSGIVDMMAGGAAALQSEYTSYAALSNDGSLWEWGRRHAMRRPYVVGEPTQISVENRLRVDGLPPVAAIVTDRGAGGESLARLKDGTLALWGGQINLCNPDLKLPLAIDAMHGATSFAKALDDTYAVTADGALWMWGREDRPGGGNRCMEKAKQLLPPGSAHSVATASLSRLVLMTDGTIWAWGQNIPNSAANMKKWTQWEDRVQVRGLPKML